MQDEPTDVGIPDVGSRSEESTTRDFSNQVGDRKSGPRFAVRKREDMAESDDGMDSRERTWPRGGGYDRGNGYDRGDGLAEGSR